MATGSDETRGRTPRGEGAQGAVIRLEERTTEQLYALAAELGIPGHLELSRPELIEAIRRR
jgi:hypothetical protein